MTAGNAKNLYGASGSKQNHVLQSNFYILHGRRNWFAGDYTPDLAALLSADIIIATPEKWDGISRNWQSRGYVKKVQLLLCIIVLMPSLLVGAPLAPGQ